MNSFIRRMNSFIRRLKRQIQKVSGGNIFKVLDYRIVRLCHLSSTAAGTTNVHLLAHVFTATYAIFLAYVFLFSIFLPVYLCEGRLYCLYNCSTLAVLWNLNRSFPSLPQCGFFQRSRYEDSVPRYHAVRIRKEQRQIEDGKCKDLETKQWFTKWNENESYS